MGAPGSPQRPYDLALSIQHRDHHDAGVQFIESLLQGGRDRRSIRRLQGLMNGGLLGQEQEIEALLHPARRDLGGRLPEGLVEPRAQELLSRTRSGSGQPEPEQPERHHCDRQREQQDSGTKR